MNISNVDRIRLIQQALIYSGYMVSVDGIYGQQTERALKAFKWQHGFSKDTRINEEVLALLLDNTKGMFPNDWQLADTRNIPAHLQQLLFPQADKSFVHTVFVEINQYKRLFCLDTPLRQAHSLAQVRAEVGPHFRLSENLNYSVASLQKLFRVYQDNPTLAQQHGRSTYHPADQQAIANHAYANRMGNGNTRSGDGWRFRGRGIKALTGRANYRAFTHWHNKLFKSDSVNFEINPELLETPRYAARSGAFFWLENELHLIADRGPSNKNVHAITWQINRYLPADIKAQRVNHFNTIWEILS